MSGGPELEALIDAAVTAAELESGVPPSIAVSRSRLNPAEIETSLDEAQAAGLARPNLGRWTPEEEAFVRDRLGKMSLEAIATAIGRTEAAVKVRFTRKGWAAPSKRQGELVARDVARRLGKCGKAIKALIERGVLPGRVIPGKRGIHVVRQVTFYRWAVNPQNWIYFNPGRVRDAKLSRLIELKRRRWGDEWLTTGQVARLRGLPGGSNDVTRQIYAGKLPAVKYQFWRVRRSAAEAYRFPEGRGSASRTRVVGVGRRLPGAVRRGRRAAKDHRRADEVAALAAGISAGTAQGRGTPRIHRRTVRGKDRDQTIISRGGPAVRRLAQRDGPLPRAAPRRLALEARPAS